MWSGRLGLSKIDMPLPAELIDFEAGAELMSANYASEEGLAKLTLISYPTPAIAGAQLRKIDAANPSSSDGRAAYYTKRTGPLIAIVSGAVSPSEARSLLASVNYEADVTWNQATHLTRSNNLGSLLVNVVLLLSGLLAISLAAGVAFGGVRILAEEILPGPSFRPHAGCRNHSIKPPQVATWCRFWAKSKTGFLSLFLTLSA